MPRPKGRSPVRVLTVTLAPDVKTDALHIGRTWPAPLNEVITKLLEHALYGVPLPAVAARPDAGTFDPSLDRTLTTTVRPAAKENLERLAEAWHMNQNEVITRLIHYLLYGVPLPPIPPASASGGGEGLGETLSGGRAVALPDQVDDVVLG